MVFFWFRRDLRFTDNRGFYEALRAHKEVVPVFIFDSVILEKLSSRDARVEFIYAQLSELNKKFKNVGSSLLVEQGRPEEVWKNLIKKYKPEAIYLNRDYEPYAVERDQKIASISLASGVEFLSFKDQVIFEKEEILNGQGNVYKVFTPYSNKWKQSLKQNGLTTYPSEKYLKNLSKLKFPKVMSLKALGFEPSGISFPKKLIAKAQLKAYAKKRDFPAQEATYKTGSTS